MQSGPYLGLLLRSALLGVAGGVFTIVYLFLVETGTHLLWADTNQVGWFSGTWQSLLIPVAAGLLVGILYETMSLPPRFKGFIDELEEGEVDPASAPGAVLVAVVSLIGGASLGPEAPLGTGAGAAGTWLARRTRADEATTRAMTFAGMSAAFGGLVSSPLGGPLLAFELEHEQSRSYYFGHLIPGIVAGAVSFGIVWPVLGAPFIGLYEVSGVEFRSWMLAAAVGIGFIGAFVSLGIGRVMVSITGWMRRLDGQPVVRGVVGGFGIAGAGFLLPLTLFSGQGGLAVVLEDPVSVGWVTLVSLIAVKAIALALSLGAGFYGGPIFPLFFIGGVLGVLIHVVVPALPLGLAVGGAMAALGAAAAFIPLSLTILASLIIQADFLMSGAILIAAISGFVFRFWLLGQGRRADVQTASRS